MRLLKYYFSPNYRPSHGLKNTYGEKKLNIFAKIIAQFQKRYYFCIAFAARSWLSRRAKCFKMLQ